ncbi:MAG: 2-dehydropantoate 2-reductase [Gammaproteobacteria bacterium]|jgi:2-dehydropantoate 2-reductase
MRIAVVGAGAMGQSYGGHLARSGHEVRLVDIWREHVGVINQQGARLRGVLGDHTVKCPAFTELPEPGWADVVIVFVDANSTEAGAHTAKAIRAPDGCVISFQNGIGNVEVLVDVIGRAHVLGGSSMCSAALEAPGIACLTHLGPTSIGELDGTSDTARVRALGQVLEGAGFAVNVEPDVMAKIWNKCAVNAAINAICATTGLRLGEMIQIPEIDAFQTEVLKEVLAVVEAKGIKLPDPDIIATIKKHCQVKFSRPSMLQHVEAGRRTEIDAINGAIVREASALGLSAPYNAALTALLKGRERRETQRLHEPAPDYEALEAGARAQLTV